MSRKNAGSLLGGLIGRILGKGIEEVTEITRAALAARMREAVEEFERGDIVSDEDIDALKSSLDEVRRLQGR